MSVIQSFLYYGQFPIFQLVMKITSVGKKNGKILEMERSTSSRKEIKILKISKVSKFFVES